jgi:hypothetical protein
VEGVVTRRDRVGETATGVDLLTRRVTFLEHVRFGGSRDKDAA